MPGASRSDRDGRDPLVRRHVVRVRSASAAILWLDRPASAIGVAARLMARSVSRPTDRGALPWSVGSPFRSAWRGSPRPGSGRPVWTASRLDRRPTSGSTSRTTRRPRWSPGPACRSRSRWSTPTRSSTNGSWAMPRSTSATGPARSRTTATARPRCRWLPAPTRPRPWSSITRGLPVHLPPAWPRGVRHGGRAARRAGRLAEDDQQDGRDVPRVDR